MLRMLMLVGVGVNLYSMTGELHAPLAAVLSLVYLDSVIVIFTEANDDD